MAICSTVMISPPSGPKTVAPNIFLVSNINNGLHKATGIAGFDGPGNMGHGQFGHLVIEAQFFASVSSMPTLPSCGSVNMQYGTGLSVMYRFCFSTMIAVNYRIVVIGDMGKRRAALYIAKGINTFHICFKRVFTLMLPLASVSIPRLILSVAVCGVRPTATNTWLHFIFCSWPFTVMVAVILPPGFLFKFCSLRVCKYIDFSAIPGSFAFRQIYPHPRAKLSWPIFLKW
jgi:hypothetical protein